MQNRYPLRDAKKQKPRGMRVVYDPEQHRLSLINKDIGQYAYQETPILTKQQVLQHLRLGDRLLSHPEVVYLLEIMTESSSTSPKIQFLPAIKFRVAGTSQPFFQPLLP